MYMYVNVNSQSTSVCSLCNLHLPSVSMYMHVKSLSNRESRSVFGWGSLLEFFPSCLDSESRCILLPYPLFLSTLAICHGLKLSVCSILSSFTYFLYFY